MIQTVTQVDFENLDPLTLPSQSLASKKFKLPPVSGIYFAVSKSNEILYIGKSINLYRRWQFNHHRRCQLEAIGKVRVTYLAITVKRFIDLDPIERIFINRFKPSLNMATIGDAFLLQRVEELEKENAKLRKQLSKLKDNHI